MNIQLVQFKSSPNNYYIMNGDEKCGTITVKDQTVLPYRHSIDIMLYRNKQGQGIGTAALIKLQEEYNGKPLYANIRQTNKASIKAFEKAGFELVGKDKNGQFIYKSN
jgi:RimJ/RimL family protein N-acetyltransferase